MVNSWNSFIPSTRLKEHACLTRRKRRKQHKQHSKFHMLKNHMCYYGQDCTSNVGKLLGNSWRVYLSYVLDDNWLLSAA